MEIDDSPFMRRIVRAGATVPRIGLGIIFLWFGGLKLVSGMSPAEDLAGRTLISLTFHLFPAAALVRVLGGVECAIGICFLFGFAMRATLTVFFVHMAGTFMALILCPSDCFGSGPLALTLIGQYVMKNIVLISAGVSLIPTALADGRRAAEDTVSSIPEISGRRT
ncbi:MAG: hypothetical protein ABIQ57_11485 [Candidatus Kapaibacterium sp.]